MLLDLGALARGGRLDWLGAALLIAADAEPGMDSAAQRQIILDLAKPLRAQRLHTGPAIEQARAVADHLFLGLGFRGNDTDYEDPRNSLINHVLQRRLGIPISLALVFVEVARELGIPAVGVGFPGHFLVKINDERMVAGIDRSVFVDPFCGDVLEDIDLQLLAERATGHAEVMPQWLRPASVEQIVVRMLHNLRNAYQRAGDSARLLLVLHRLCELEPSSGALLRDRGLLQARLGAPRAAVEDLESYLSAAPHASDVQDIQELIDNLTDRLHRAHPKDALN